MDFELDYENDLNINPDELDIAALEQSNLAMKYSEAAAYYERRVKKAWERVKTIRSELTRDANLDPDGCLGKGIKPTAGNIEAYYRTHEDYRAAKEALTEAEYERDLAKAAADHISFQRKKMIEVLAQLLNMEYFAGPSIPRNLSREYREHRKGRIEAKEQAARPRRRRKKN